MFFVAPPTKPITVRSIILDKEATREERIDENGK